MKNSLQVDRVMKADKTCLFLLRWLMGVETIVNNVELEVFTVALGLSRHGQI